MAEGQGCVLKGMAREQDGYIGDDENWEYTNKFIQPVKRFPFQTVSPSSPS